MPLYFIYSSWLLALCSLPKNTMTKISKYVLKEFLAPLVFSFSALAVLMLVSELMERLDKFIAAKAGFGVVLQYLLSTLPVRAIEILPVAALLAALFSLGNLSRRQEITAAMSGGITPWTMVKPILFCGLVLSLFSWILSEGVVPWASQKAENLWNIQIRRLTSPRQTKFNNLAVAGEKNTFYSIGMLDTDEQLMENIVIDKMDANGLMYQIQAKSAKWENSILVFRNGIERFYKNNGLTIASQKAFTKREGPLNDFRGENCVQPEDLVPREPDAECMNYKNYNRHLRRLRTLGISTRKQEVELHLKLAFPFTSFIVLLLGIPFAFQKTGGKVKAIGFALGTAFFYFGLMQIGRALGQKPWCPPILGAWFSNLVFICIGTVLFYRMTKKS